MAQTEVARLKAELESNPTVRRKLAYAIECAKDPEHDTEAMRVFLELTGDPQACLDPEEWMDVLVWAGRIKTRWKALARPKDIGGLVALPGLHPELYPRGIATPSKRRLWRALQGVDERGPWPDPEERR